MEKFCQNLLTYARCCCKMNSFTCTKLYRCRRKRAKSGKMLATVANILPARSTGPFPTTFFHQTAAFCLLHRSGDATGQRSRMAPRPPASNCGSQRPFAARAAQPSSCPSTTTCFIHRSIGQTLQSSFSAVSKPNFARKYAFESSRRDLHNALFCRASNPNSELCNLNFLSKFCRMIVDVFT